MICELHNKLCAGLNWFCGETVFQPACAVPLDEVLFMYFLYLVAPIPIITSIIYRIIKGNYNINIPTIPTIIFKCKRK